MVGHSWQAWGLDYMFGWCIRRCYLLSCGTVDSQFLLDDHVVFWMCLRIFTTCFSKRGVHTVYMHMPIKHHVVWHYDSITDQSKKVRVASLTQSNKVISLCGIYNTDYPY